ncbi:MAG: radical SAM protein [Acutalibacteraceae bacterium]|jgi:MoaA/NifB/PqqE/SkfB family radical SAM enzyme
MKDNVVSRRLVRRAIRAAIKDPDKNIPRILSLIEKADQKGVNAHTYANLRKSLENPQDNWNALVHRLFQNVDPRVLENMLMSLGFHAAIVSAGKRMENVTLYSCNIPWAILMDPTAACNLHCVGCWAAEYGKNTSLSYETMDRVIHEGKTLGTYVYIFSGGEPTMRKGDLIRLAKAHPDCAFLAFTNGTLVDDAFAEELKRVGNFALAFSIEGSEEDTDFRRGAGTYRSVIRAMDILREKGIVFGFSACYTSQNLGTIGSDAFVDLMIEKGCLFGWYFTYIPIGKDAVPGLMVSAPQRERMLHTMREWRRTKPCFLLDFWNDGEYVHGCIAGGRHYLHINANGDVEPCAFIHYSNVNILSCSLLDALRSPLFEQYRKNQPFNANMLRPCPMLDNPQKLREMVACSGAHSTDLLAPESAAALTAKTEQAAKDWAARADALWSGLGKEQKDEHRPTIFPENNGDPR